MARPPRSALVVGDPTLMGAYAAAILRALGFVTTAAATGYQAMDRLAERSFDLCIVDLDMPQSDGMTIFALTLLDKRRSGGPVVIGSSAHPDTARRGPWADEAALAGFLRKPFRPGDLINLVETSVLRRARG